MHKHFLMYDFFVNIFIEVNCLIQVLYIFFLLISYIFLQHFCIQIIALCNT